MARTITEIEDEIVTLKTRMDQDAERLGVIQNELYKAKHGFAQGEPVDFEGEPGTVWFDGLMFVFHANSGMTPRKYLKDASRLTKKASS